jgi:ABC-type Mn2+/Zn2+ transport system ATPase subunit
MKGMDMENNKFVFQMSGLTLTYGDRTVLKDVNFVVKPGEFWFLLGPNGAGKTTLLNVLLGIIQPQQGSLLLHHELGSRGLMGFVPQRCDLNPTLPTTVKEFVSLGLAGIRTDKKDRHDRLSWALEKMHLKEMEHKSYWSLSGGQRQRALVARALIRRPKFLIADEPNMNLDLPAVHALLEALKDLNQKENLTVLFVTHDLTLAARYATHIALFRDGQVRVGTTQVILNQDDLELTYGIPVTVSEETNGALCVHIGKKERER